MGLFNNKKIEEELRKQITDMQNEITNYKNKIIEYEVKNGKIENLNKLIKEKKDKIEDKKNKLNNIKIDINNSIDNIKKLQDKIEDLTTEKQNVIDAIDMGAYQFSYHYDDIEKYETELKNVKQQQSDMMKNETAISHEIIWTVDGSERKGRTQMKNIDKLLLRAFNNECDNIIMNVKYSTIASSNNKIEKSFNQLNNFVKSYECEITNEYLELKYKELELRCGYVTLKQQIKEEQARIREQMREEERIRKELEEQEKKINKEEKHFQNEITKLENRLNKSEGNEIELLRQIAMLKGKLEELEVVKKDVMNRKLNNKAGYVYVISNPSFEGEVYKIGVTRRLDPMDRVNELSSASVPFKYGVNAMIFSEDAFDLEHKLHQIFDNNRVNKINKKKEFFNISIDEIEKAVKENFNETVEFTKTLINDEYQMSLNL